MESIMAELGSITARMLKEREAEISALTAQRNRAIELLREYNVWAQDNEWCPICDHHQCEPHLCGTVALLAEIDGGDE